MTIRDPAAAHPGRVALAATLASVCGAGALLLGCGQRGPLRLPTAGLTASAAATARPPLPSAPSASAVDARDPFAQPAPTSEPAPTPHP